MINWRNLHERILTRTLKSKYTCTVYIHVYALKKKKRYQMLKLLLNYYMCTSPTTISKINGVYFITIKEKVKDST